MSVVDLSQAIDALPRRAGPDAVLALDRATGKRIGKKEQHLLERLLHDHYDRFSKDGLFALELLAGKASPARTKAIWKVGDRHETDVAEQSALAFVSAKHGFLAADDESSVLWAVSTPKGKAHCTKTALREDDGELKGLEGLAIDREAGTALVVSENRRCIHELSFDDSGADLALGRPRLLGYLPKNPRANKGWEGLAVLPSHASPDKKPRLLSVQEGDPPLLVVFARQPKRRGGEFKVEAEIALPTAIAAMMPDLSDLTFDPKTGHLYLLSDEGRTIFECALGCSTRAFGGRAVNTWGLVPIGHTTFPELTGDVRFQAEGLAFDAKGDLFVLGEGRTSILHLLRQ